jgi:hypothetical protein
VFVQNLQSAEQAGTSGQQTAQVADQSQQPTDLSATQYQTAANSYAGSNQLQAQTDAPAYQPNPTQQTQPLATGAAAGVAV